MNNLRLRRELPAFAAAILLANISLLFGAVCEPLIFIPAQVAAGEWWRCLTFPLVHVSLYHLLLDASAFLLLYHGLHEPSAVKRLGTVAAGAAGSLGLSLLGSPLPHGLCGLSGIAHGLMAVSALELLQTPDRKLRRAAQLCFSAVVLKSLYEALSGHILFESLHSGQIGTPVAACHAGGVAGALLFRALSRIRGRPLKTDRNL